MKTTVLLASLIAGLVLVLTTTTSGVAQGKAVDVVMSQDLAEVEGEWYFVISATTVQRGSSFYDGWTLPRGAWGEGTYLNDEGCYVATAWLSMEDAYDNRDDGLTNEFQYGIVEGSDPSTGLGDDASWTGYGTWELVLPT